MDEDLRFWLSILLFFVVLPVLSIFLLNRWSNKYHQKSKLRLSEARLQLEQSQSSEPNFVCYGIEAIDASLVQLHGSPYKTALRPGMKLTVLGIEYPIKEVYANDNSLDKPDAEIPENSENVAIVIEASSFDSKSFQQQLQSQSTLNLKVAP